MPSQIEKLQKELSDQCTMWSDEYDKTRRVERILPVLLHPCAGDHPTIEIAFNEVKLCIKRLHTERSTSLDTFLEVARLCNTLHRELSRALLEREDYYKTVPDPDEEKDITS